MWLPSNIKHDVKFRYETVINFLVTSHYFYLNQAVIGLFKNKLTSGTEVCLSVSESVDVLLAEINCFFHQVSFFFILPNLLLIAILGKKLIGS